MLHRPTLKVLGVATAVLAMLATTALAHAKQRHFASPEEAVSELVAAVESGKKQALLDILGAEAKSIVDSGDPIADQMGRERFVEEYRKGHALKGGEADQQILEIGDDHWPFPIPLTKDEQGWSFDTAAGKEEVLNRRIGRNELAAIQACLAYVDAQREYYLSKPVGEPLRYAQRITSSQGKRDGLYWPAVEGEGPSPLGDLFANASVGAYEGKSKSAPFYGYHYRILTKQGANAKGGAYDYLAHGKMIGGFALIAYPATYEVSGVMTFLVNHAGQVFEKDLGPKTKAIAQDIRSFDPDETWRPVEQAD